MMVTARKGRFLPTTPHHHPQPSWVSAIRTTIRQTIDGLMGRDAWVEQVIAAAASHHPLHFPKVNDAAVHRLPNQATTFDHALRSWPADMKEWPGQSMKKMRLHWVGGAHKATDIVAGHAGRIAAAHEAVLHDPKLAHAVVPAALVQAVMFVENNYNGGDTPGDKTKLPMNINYTLWRHAFTAYNASHPKTPITAHTIEHDASSNIVAGTIILSTINAAVDPSLTDEARWATVASIYGNTKATLVCGGIIPYGAVVEQAMQPRYTPAAPAHAAHPTVPHMPHMDIRHTPMTETIHPPAYRPTNPPVGLSK